MLIFLKLVAQSHKSFVLFYFFLLSERHIRPHVHLPHIFSSMIQIRANGRQ